MDRKKIILACLAALFLGLLGAGCRQKKADIVDMTVLEKHKAVGMYQDGVWAPRYVSINAAESGSEKESALAVATVDIKKDMTEDEMMEILDYYTEYAALAYDTGEGIDCLLYAIFYQDGTDNEIFRIKCLNGEETEPAKEDSSIFPLPGIRTEVEGELP